MSIRTRRVAKLLQREIADVLMKEYDDGHLMTVTHTRITRDLSIVYVHVSVLGESEEQRQEAISLLQKHTPAIRSAVAHRVRHQLRAVPEIRFFLDDSLTQVRKMETLFDQIREERRQRESETP